MNVDTVSEELQRWILDQAQAGRRPEDVLAAMQRSGWTEEAAIAAMEHVLGSFLDQRALARTLPAPVRVPEPLAAGSPNRLRVQDVEVTVLLSMRNPRIVLFGGLLSDAECDQLIAEALPRMARSETVVYATGGNAVHPARTSDGMFFVRGESPLCARIEARLAALLQWPLVNGEGLQVLRYRPGTEYEPHHDYFDPAHPGFESVLRRGGQRVGTLLMYLNTTARGGVTTFPESGLEIAPIKGNAVFFSYDRAHASTRTLHGGAAVVDGEKWVATKWLREGQFD
jgi:prolyl 4-hydroxylase